MSVLSNFQGLAYHYQNARQGFDSRVFDYLATQSGGMFAKDVLDIGCGTGIATRHLLARGAHVVGCDESSDMVAKAEECDSGVIQYHVAKASALPFESESFDIVTAFSAFHWFSDADSVREIKRVMKPRGLFAVVNKNDIAGIRTDVVQCFAEYLYGPTGKETYDPAGILARHFGEVRTVSFNGVETFTLSKGVEYLQSIALWNLVPPEGKSAVLDRIRVFATERFENEGTLERHIVTTVVIAYD